MQYRPLAMHRDAQIIINEWTQYRSSKGSNIPLCDSLLRRKNYVWMSHDEIQMVMWIEE